MPKRDDLYMEKQRTRIAEAALKVLLEKGVYETTLRDICSRAGVSMGALYTHYATKDDLIVAACALDWTDRERTAAVSDWNSYLALARTDVGDDLSDRQRRRFRLSMQFVAELWMRDSNPPGLSTIYLIYRNQIERSLKACHERGEIELPLGLPSTVEAHMQIIAGANYQRAADRELDGNHIRNAMEKALALTAGRKEGLNG